ncbi:hypothetical protein OUZ56_025102 [Daphnia magna]|uniref:Uncharacterized protein n=1 Tax=Daphnia magna TaxID=35525 RepID=A0ABQ9ZJH5_9CRUS|nr:hypothetical protein OUZ56_025102 [Daphnia magna]
MIPNFRASLLSSSDGSRRIEPFFFLLLCWETKTKESSCTTTSGPPFDTVLPSSFRMLERAPPGFETVKNPKLNRNKLELRRIETELKPLRICSLNSDNN